MKNKQTQRQKNVFNKTSRGCMIALRNNCYIDSKAMMKIKQLRSRLLLRLSKFDMAVVVNLKTISKFFGVYTSCFFALETIGVS